MRQLALDLSPPPAPGFDNFVAASNAEAMDAARGFACAVGKEHCIYLWGAAGSGKTHLLCAAAAIAGARAVWTQREHSLPAPAAVPPAALLIVDDVHRLDDGEQIALFNLYNEAVAGGFQLLVSGPLAPAQLALRAELATRLGAALVYRLEPLDDEAKADALHRHAQSRGFALSDDAVAYLLRHVRRDLPTLLTLLDALDRYSLAAKRAITVPLIRELIRPRATLDAAAG